MKSKITSCMLVINDADVRRKFYWKKAPMTDQIDQSFLWLWKCIFATWIWISMKLDNFLLNLHLLNIKVTQHIHMVCNIHVYNCRYACTYVPLQDCSYCWCFIQGWCKYFGVFHFQITQNCIINDITCAWVHPNYSEHLWFLQWLFWCRPI